MTTPTTPTCATCRFWQPKPSAAYNLGECRRMPPLYHRDTPDTEQWSGWPYCTGDSWCGEHKPAAQQENADVGVNVVRELLLDTETGAQKLRAMQGELRDQLENAQEFIRRLLHHPAATPENPDAGARALELLREVGTLADKHVCEWVKVNPCWPERVRKLLRESGEGAK